MGLSLGLRFVFYFAVSAGAVLAAYLWLDYQGREMERAKLQEADSVRVALAGDIIMRDLREVVATIQTLAGSPILADYLQQRSVFHRRRLEAEFINLAEHTGIYDQIRFIDPGGRERVRVNYNQGSPTAVSAGRLQDKSHRYYFQQAIGLNRGEVYLSPLDLNIEENAVERPFKPMIRAAMALFGESGRPQGVLVMNYLAADLLAHFEQAMAGSAGEAMLLNPEGYWLYSPHEEDEWAFMWGEERLFGGRYPQAWGVMQAEDQGAVETAAGLFVFAAVRPSAMAGFGNLIRLTPSDSRWMLVSRVTPEALALAPWATLRARPAAVDGLLLLVAVLSLAIAWLRTYNVQNAKALQASEEQVRLLLESVAEGVVGLDIQGRCTFINPAGLRLLGYQHESQLVGRELHGLIHHTRRDGSRCPPEDCRVYGAFRQDREFQESDEVFWRADGSCFDVEYRSHPVRREGKAVGAVATFTDISARRQAERHLRQAATVFDSTNEAITIADAEGKITAVNRAFTAITGFQPEDVLGQNPRLQRSGRHDQAFYQTLRTELERAGHWQGEIWNRRKNGEAYPAWENISAVKDDQGRITNYVSVFSDISAIKEAEERLTHLAHHDPLTDLPNRLLFKANLDQSLERARRHQQMVALMFLDLDRFKLINDTLGHAAGDQLLQTVAQRLKNCVRAEDTVARLGGDEFTIVLEEIAHAEDAAHLAGKIIAAVAEPFPLHGREVATSTSIGISLFPSDATSSEGMAKAADAALYRAKDRGRNTYEFYTRELTEQALEHLALENALRQALARGELEVHYQPQVEIVGGRMVGVEALLRWRHPALGLISPERFIAVAEESGLIEPIGEWVVSQACAQAGAWLASGLPSLRLAINLSGRQILYRDTVASVAAALRDNGLEAKDVQLEFEVTENMLQSMEQGIEALRRLRAMGMGIAVDDFGTGYSSLSHLQHLPIDTLKIDQLFVRGIPDDRDSRAITSAIISMGHSLGLRIVAEGVETEEQLAFLRQQVCDEAQGYLFGRPCPPEAIAAMVDGRGAGRPRSEIADP